MAETPRKRRTGAIDRHIGARIRGRRMALGIRQKTLAIDIGVTTQQLQKYETGINRVSASKLFEIARALAVSISEFFDLLPATAPDASRTVLRPDFERMLGTEEGEALLALFPRLASSDCRRAIVAVVRAMVKAPPEIPAR